MILVLAIYVGEMRTMTKKYKTIYGITHIEKTVGQKIYKKYMNDQI